MKLADRHGRPLCQVLSEYPEWEMPYWAVWMAREPDPGRRVEFAVARMASAFVGTQASSKSRHKVPGPDAFVWPDMWERKRAESDMDELTAAFREAGIRIIDR